MTDLEKFKELYKSVGIELKEEKVRNELVLHLENDVNEKFTGYTFFYSNIIFDLEGKFISQGFYE